MNNKKIGSFIARLRKEKLMTQRDLADKLNVTNKAVSKWETGEGYPEITTLPVLAEILGVTTSELLNGEYTTKAGSDTDPANIIIKETVSYCNKNVTRNNNIVFSIITAVFLFSAFVCLLCNYLINHAVTWSLYPIGALFLMWAVLFPIFKIKKFKALASLFGLTITLIPYLFLVEYLAEVKGWVLPLALPITIVSLIALGITILIFNNNKILKLYSIAIAIFLFGVVVNLSVGIIVDDFVEISAKNDISMFTTTIVSIFFIILLVSAGYIRDSKTKQSAHK